MNDPNRASGFAVALSAVMYACHVGNCLPVLASMKSSLLTPEAHRCGNARVSELIDMFVMIRAAAAVLPIASHISVRPSQRPVRRRLANSTIGTRPIP